MERCDAKLNPSVRYTKKKRPDGSSYTVRFESGERCPNEALISRREYGRTVRRCLDHLKPAQQIAA